MSQISSWLLSICGMIFISIIVEIILPNKKINSIVKTVVGIFTLLIIVKPISNIDLSKISFGNITSNISIDNKFVDLRNNEKMKALSTSIESSLDSNGYKNTTISFDVDYEKSLINTVFVDLSKLVLSSQNLNINKYTNIVAIVQQFVNIKEGQVVFNE